MVVSVHKDNFCEKSITSLLVAAYFSYALDWHCAVHWVEELAFVNSLAGHPEGCGLNPQGTFNTCLVYI